MPTNKKEDLLMQNKNKHLTFQDRVMLEDCESKAPNKIENIVAKFGDYIMLIEPEN